LKPIILSDGRNAISNRSYWSSLRENNVVVSMGIHEDIFIREHSEWKCLSRTIKHVGERGPLYPKKMVTSRM